MLHYSQFLPGIIIFRIIICSFKKLHVNFTKNLQSLLYLCLILSLFVKQNRNFPCVKSRFWDKTLTYYNHRTMSTWVQSKKSIAAWIHCIRNKGVQAPGRPSFLTLHHPTTLEDSTRQTKTKTSYKNCTLFYSLPSELLHNIDMWYAGIVHTNKLKPFSVRLTQHRPLLRESMWYFDYYMYYNHIKYVWVGRRLGSHNSVHK